MTQEEFDTAPLLDQILYDETGMLVENHPDIAEAMEKYHQAKLKLLGLSIVGVSLPIESFDVDDWLGITHGVWYHPFIELHNYDNGDKKSIELAQIIADYANSIIQQ